MKTNIAVFIPGDSRNRVLKEIIENVPEDFEVEFNDWNTLPQISDKVA